MRLVACPCCCGGYKCVVRRVRTLPDRKCYGSKHTTRLCASAGPRHESVISALKCSFVSVSAEECVNQLEGTRCPIHGPTASISSFAASHRQSGNEEGRTLAGARRRLNNELNTGRMHRACKVSPAEKVS